MIPGTRARAPTMCSQDIRRRTDCVGGDVEIAGAVGQDVLWHELRLADLAAHGAAGVDFYAATAPQGA
jgi:hypothetical protein